MKRTKSNIPNRSSKRRGSLYISVMGVTLIISMIGLSSMLAVRMQMKQATNISAKEESQQLAFSGIEYALCQIAVSPSWRSSYTHNTESTIYNVGNGTVSFILFDDDGDLADDTTDSVRLIGIGRVGNITYKESVLLMPTGNGLTCLEPAFHCNGSVSLGFTVDLVTNQIVSSNTSISATSLFSQVDGDAESVFTIQGDITGSSTTGITPRVMPGSDAFEYYKKVGTWIDVSSLPTESGNPLIEKAILSPTVNQYGPATNLEGIYILDCAGSNLTIKNSRIEATLVILNPGASTRISNSIHWEAAVKNYPALLVQGDIEMRTTISPLSEANLATNFNPASFPFQGSSDTDTTDEYSSEIIGLVYVSGDLDFPPDALDTKITGCVVSSTCQPNSDFEVNYYNTYRDYPPPGFATGPGMAIIPGTRRREP